ncbi:MAG: insulinase family protein, partial [Longimicrobiales bacterium]
ALADVLRLRLRDVLREELSGTYGVSVYGGIARAPDQEYSFGIGFSAAPDSLDSLVAEVFRQIESIQTAGPTADELAKVKEAMRRSRETTLEQNEFWLGRIAAAEIWAEDLGVELREDAARVEALTRDDIAAAASRFLDFGNYVRVSLRPEG